MGMPLGVFLPLPGEFGPGGLGGSRCCLPPGIVVTLSWVNPWSVSGMGLAHRRSLRLLSLRFWRRVCGERVAAPTGHQVVQRQACRRRLARAQQVLRRQQWTADGHTAGPRQAYRVCPAGAQQALGSGQIDSAGPEWGLHRH